MLPDEVRTHRQDAARSMMTAHAPGGSSGAAGREGQLPSSGGWAASAADARAARAAASDAFWAPHRSDRGASPPTASPSPLSPGGGVSTASSPEPDGDAMGAAAIDSSVRRRESWRLLEMRREGV